MSRFDFSDRLYVEGEKVVWRDKDGTFVSAPVPPFYDGQIVRTSGGHFSPKKFTEVMSPSWDGTTWWYGEHYIDITDRGGGSGWSFQAALFEEITDPLYKLYAERIYRKRESRRLSDRLKTIEQELSKIQYALDLMEPKS